MNITVEKEVLAELEYMVKLHKEHGAPQACDSVESLIGYILASIADGSRRPGAWERQMLEMMGIVADCEDHHVYRWTYGRPEVKQ